MVRTYKYAKEVNTVRTGDLKKKKRHKKVTPVATTKQEQKI